MLPLIAPPDGFHLRDRLCRQRLLQPLDAILAVLSSRDPVLERRILHGFHGLVDIGLLSDVEHDAAMRPSAVLSQLDDGALARVGFVEDDVSVLRHDPLLPAGRNGDDHCHQRDEETIDPGSHFRVVVSCKEHPFGFKKRKACCTPKILLLLPSVDSLTCRRHHLQPSLSVSGAVEFKDYLDSYPFS